MSTVAAAAAAAARTSPSQELGVVADYLMDKMEELEKKGPLMSPEDQRRYDDLKHDLAVIAPRYMAAARKEIRDANDRE